MDQDTVITQFEILERKIEQLIEACKVRDAEIAQLRQGNEQMTRQLQEQAAVQEKDEALKTLIRSKVDGLMNRLSEFADEKD
ncbi:hypothetical protein [Desulfatitalea alkaliphila]|uniref:Cell division protein ZapB n=1 Tax=Desulfatitalea alkaliphila TaxID=2929485 RepID=A0AA41R3D2_9BACT|nr:hypothetical protein [Desulfatitalea alkaliphila]MCJ8502397.1 hypothetical protein [Desulfatitalea alkaliphila]